ncbi:MAG TPA: alpha/beta hydrolase [Longimicrobium sp.]|uniref:alpha/beta fold hydrolase n=1 Tax=Longimicrobium sp. TaxID=2029185 RepID=UPI002EDB56DC
MSDRPAGGFVSRDGVRLHVLRWESAGPALVLVPGLGQSAHVFRELAPALAGDFRVIAFTPRGHGQSATPTGDYTLEGFADDLRAVLDGLQVERAIVVAHSLGGTVATRLAVRSPGRVRGIVYLDALHDYGRWGEVMMRNPFPPPPRPDFGDRDATRAWMTRYVPGFWCDALEADLKAHAWTDMASWRSELVMGLLDDATVHPTPYAQLRCPALALVAAESLRTQFGWLQPMEGADRERAEAYLRTVREPWRRASEARFVREAPGARVVRIDGGHYFFLTARDRVAAEIRAFASSLTPLDT